MYAEGSPGAPRGARSVGCAVLMAWSIGASAEAGAAECALLWAPSGKLDTPALARLLEKRPALRLSLAVSPADVPDPGGLAALARQGRIELALRLEGDPLLPLIATYRGEDAVFRLAIARQKHREAFGEPAAGLFPGAGALSEALLPALAAQGLRWAASGDYRALPDDAWASRGSLTLAPSRPLGAAAVLPDDAKGVYALDETGSWLSPGSGLELLSSWPDAVLEACSATVAELSSSAAKTDKLPASPPTFAGDSSVLTSGEERKRAWALYGAAVSALAAYQNSGAAALPVLDKATEALYRAQDSRFFLAEGLAGEKAGAELRERLRRVYQLLRQPVPDELRGASGRETPEAAKASGGKALDDPGSVEAGLEGDLLWFSNPEGSGAFRPAPPPQSPSADPWTFRSMSASWDEAEVTFSFALKKFEPSPAARFGFEGLMVDLYIDVNHRPRQGSTDLLEGREGFVPQADAWEYALVASPSDAWLLRFVPGQGPVVVDAPRVEADFPAGELRLSVPRSKLRGDPSAWGYLPLALSPLSPDPSAKPAALKLPLPARGEHGSTILGLIAPIAAQKRLGSSPAHRRLPFLRLHRRKP